MMKKIERTEVNELLNIVSTKNTSNITIKEEKILVNHIMI